MANSVVIVDDSKYLTALLKDFMEQELQFDVKAVGHNGHDAIELYDKFRPDILTLDITMPQKDGLQALRDINERWPDAKVVLLTAIRDNEMNQFMKKGAAAFIEKPLLFDDEEFVKNFKDVIAEVLDD